MQSLSRSLSLSLALSLSVCLSVSPSLPLSLSHSVCLPAARRIAVLLGALALLIPAMFALLVALATKALVVRELEEWDSVRMT